jgi:NAD(P)-dependent dehydrogenase (short-subunit alcohol dehydrogenase family)
MQRPNALRPGKLRGSTDKLEEEMPKLDGKIAIITGGSSGIGLATAKVFVKEGARVYITGRRQAELEATGALLGPRATPVQGDVAKPADLDRLYDQIRNEVGRVDVVFANAGGVMVAPLGSLTEEHIDYHLDVNVKGVIWTVQKALPAPGHCLVEDAAAHASCLRRPLAPPPWLRDLLASPGIGLP